MTRILLAVSGGMDSMYMLARRGELFPDAEVAAAHCNFGLRGAESDADEQFVRAWCLENGIPLFCERFDTGAYAKENHISIEMAARELRYAWFSRLMEEEGFDAVAVAHNAGDNAETLILNLLRGTGSRGLRGMGERSLSAGGTGKVLRPLLGITREEIAAWMEGHGVPHREDSTNAATVYKRNKIRHEVFPVFAQINPSFLHTLGSDMRRFAQVDDIAEDYFREHLDKVLSRGEYDSVSIPALMGLKHNGYMLWRLLEPYGFNSDSIDSLRSLLLSGETVSGKTFCSPGWKAVTSADAITLVPRDSGTDPQDSLTVPGPGEYVYKGRRLSVRVFDKPSGFCVRRPEGQLAADAARLQFPLKLRSWKEGDWMRPLGLGGRKKLSDLFVDLKWGIPMKNRAIVLEHPDGKENHAGALLCSRIDESLKVTPDTRRIVEIVIL